MIAVVLAALAGGAPAGAQTHAASEGPGGPILVVADPGDPFGLYYAEILRAEGLNEFSVTNAGAMTAGQLAAHDVVVLAGSGALTDGQVASLTEWVQGGGNVIAMRPQPNLAPLLGLSGDTGDLHEGYLKVDTGAPPGAGVTEATMQFHGTADRWSLADARPVATLYENAGTATASPAVTLRSVGAAGGQAAAFTYDLARSVVYTRQGNPAWAEQKRDPSTESIRSVDLFHGAGLGEAHWLDFGRVAIPQADEQQRLLANLITDMNLDRTPLPRFWYLPRGEKAAVVMTGDDHGYDADAQGTSGRFETFKNASRPGCSVADWECVRATSYLFTGTVLSDAVADAYEAEGFEIALHLNHHCTDFTPETLEDAWQTDLPAFTGKWEGLAAPRTIRTHCVTWSDWATAAKAELRHGVRFDTNYYYANQHWVQNRPGMFTGSGFPMRFADLDGSLIDVYQATTHLSDESDIDYEAHIAALLDGALGPNGFYGVFTANMHTDNPSHVGADAIVAGAQARGVPVVSSVQMLDWLDGRNGSSFQVLSFDAGRLRFRIAPAAGARGLEAMLPARWAHGALLGLTADGVPVSTTPRTVKGVDYAVFPATAAEYVATYPARPAPAPAPAPAPPAGTPGPKRPGAGKPTVIRATRRGKIKLGVTCRRTKRPCRITVRLRHGGKTVARRTVRVNAGRRTHVRLQLPRAIRKKLNRRRSLRMTAVITGHRPGGKAATRQLRVRPAAR